MTEQQLNSTKSMIKLVLEGNYLEADKLLKSIVLEAEEEREKATAEELGFEDELAGDGAAEEGTAAADNADISDDSNVDTTDDELFPEETPEVSNDELDSVTDDVVEIKCEVNKKIIGILFDKITNVRTVLNNSDMDQTSREFLTLDVKISYYANKLEELQSKANVEVNQDELESRLDTINIAIGNIENELGVSSVFDASEELHNDGDLNAANDVDDVDDIAEVKEKLNAEEEANAKAEGEDESQETSHENPEITSLDEEENQAPTAPESSEVDDIDDSEI